MLTANLSFEDLGANWDASEASIQIGGGRIEIFQSSQLSWSTRRFDGGQLLWIGEVADPFEAADAKNPSDFLSRLRCG